MPDKNKLIDGYDIATYCMKCERHTKSFDIELRKSKNNRVCLSTKCVICRKKKNKFISKEELQKFPADVRKQLKEVRPQERYQGGVLPLLPSLGEIFAGVQSPKEEKKEKLTTEEKINRCIKFLSKQGYSVTLE